MSSTKIPYFVLIRTQKKSNTEFGNSCFWLVETLKYSPINNQLISILVTNDVSGVLYKYSSFRLDPTKIWFVVDVFEILCKLSKI